MKFRKRPVEVEAVQYLNSADIHEFCGDKVREPVGETYLEIDTLEGVMRANLGDYIIKGVEGEFYPCKPDIFEKTYITGSMGQVSDGYHTFDELYYHRMILFATICNQNYDIAWKSWKHHDGTMYDDYFIVGVETSKGQYSYHYHKDYWDIFKCCEHITAPEWDGHQPSDIDRLLTLI